LQIHEKCIQNISRETSWKMATLKTEEDTGGSIKVVLREVSYKGGI
jgi:hypothetical protein